MVAIMKVDEAREEAEDAGVGVKEGKAGPGSPTGVVDGGLGVDVGIVWISGCAIGSTETMGEVTGSASGGIGISGEGRLFSQMEGYKLLQ